MSELKQTPLHGEHIRLKGRMVPFAGYDMPVQYEGVIKEHEAVRQRVGLFDVSHMGEFLVSGPGARAFLNRMTTNEIDKLYDGRCQYNLLCYENGTLVDDIIVSQLASDRYFIVVNASNVDKDFAWLKKHLPASGVELQNLSQDFSLIAVQGPKSPELLKTVFNRDFSELKYYHFAVVDALPDAAPFPGTIVSRTGYTGEDGFEVLVPNTRASVLWNDLLAKGKAFGAVPAGLGCRDTLRLEAAYSLYGHELNDQTTALESGLAWVVKLDKGDFIGAEALRREKAQGSGKTLVGFELTESAIARDGSDVYSLDNQKIGVVTSGTHSPTLKKAIGLALVDSKFTGLGQEILLDIRGKRKRAVIVKKPFYKRAS